MDAAQALEILTRYHSWRRYNNDDSESAGCAMPTPTEIGQALDFVINNWGK